MTASDKPAGRAKSGLIAQGVVVAGSGLARAFIGSRDLSVRFFGRGPAHQAVARVVNTVGWCAGAMLAYHAGVAWIGRADEKIEPAYAIPPTSPLRSGSPPSKAPFAELGLQGRRYVTDVVTPELIEKTLGEPAVAEPIRAYVGFDTEPLFAGRRAEIALDELERTGAFDRSHLLLVSPTGTGWIDQTMIEAPSCSPAATSLPARSSTAGSPPFCAPRRWNSTGAGGSVGWPSTAPGPAAPAGGVPFASTTGGTTFCSRSRGTRRPISCPDHVALGHRSTMRG